MMMCVSSKQVYFHTHARARTHMHVVDRLVTGGQGASGRASAVWCAHATCGLNVDLKTSGPMTQCHESNVQRGSANLWSRLLQPSIQPSRSSKVHGLVVHYASRHDNSGEAVWNTQSTHTPSRWLSAAKHNRSHVISLCIFGRTHRHARTYACYSALCLMYMSCIRHDFVCGVCVCVTGLSVAVSTAVTVTERNFDELFAVDTPSVLPQE